MHTLKNLGCEKHRPPKHRSADWASPTNKNMLLMMNCECFVHHVQVMEPIKMAHKFRAQAGSTASYAFPASTLHIPGVGIAHWQSTHVRLFTCLAETLTRCHELATSSCAQARLLTDHPLADSARRNFKALPTFRNVWLLGMFLKLHMFLIQACPFTTQVFEITPLYLSRW